jgi:hypothetical protein
VSTWHKCEAIHKEDQLCHAASRAREGVIGETISAVSDCGVGEAGAAGAAAASD